MKKIYAPVVCLVVAAGAVSAWRGFLPLPAQAGTSPEETIVAVAHATRQDLSDGMTVTAELVPYQEVEVMAKIAGYVEKMAVDVGDHVHQGQLLATLEVPEMKDDLARAAATLERSRAELARARDELRRAESAAELAHVNSTRLTGVNKSRPGLVAQAEIDEALGRDQMAAAQAAATRSNLAAAEQQIRVAEAEQRKLRTLLEYTRVTAPFAGVITRRYADTGAMIQAGTASHSQAMPLVRLSQADRLRLTLPVPEAACDRVREGSELEFHIPTLAQTLRGRVARTAGKVDTATRTMSTQVDVLNPSGALLPGMYAEVKLTLATSPHALTVPLAAVRRKDGASQIYVVSSDGTVAVRPVQTGLETPRRVEIRAGLAEGERVIISNPSRLAAGEHVRTRLEEKGE